MMCPVRGHTCRTPMACSSTEHCDRFVIRLAPTPAVLRGWADNPPAGTPMVPVHRDTLRALARELELWQRAGDAA